METALAPLAGFTAWLLKTSAQASVLIGLVLLVQWLFRKKLSPRWRYALWMLVLIRLMLPAAPESSFSVFNYTQAANILSSRTSAVQPTQPELTDPAARFPSPASASAKTNEEFLTLSSATNIEVGRTVLSAPGGAPESLRRSLAMNDGAMRTSRPTDNWAFPSVAFWLSVCWLAGALSLSAATFWFPVRLNRQLAGQHSVVNPAVREVLADCQRVMNVRRVLPVVQSQAVHGPALMGFIRPWLLLPEGILEKFTPQELRFVFLHELAHLKRRDIAVNWLMTFLLILHWFNPLVWFAFARMRADRELACDALALSFANDQESRPYGQTILKLLEGFTRPPAIAGLVGILEDKQQMKRRITMIAQFKKSSGWPVLALALVTLLGCVSLTDSKNAGSSNRAGGDAQAMRTTSELSGQPVVRLVASDKVDHWVAFGPHTRPSPNGKYLSYINWDHGNLALYNTETGELRDLTTEGTWSGNPNQFSYDGIWSPDGTQLAYRWSMGQNGELRIVHRDGGKPKTLVPAKLWPQSWSKDGKRILAFGPFSKAGPDSGQNVDAIQLVNTLTGERTIVKQLSDNPGDPEGAGEPMIASLSPDGKLIAYSSRQQEPGSTNSASRDIRIIGIDGSNDRVLIEHPANDWTPHWMPDGKHLLFVSDRSGNNAIWMLPVSQGQKAGEPRMVRDMAGTLLGSAEDGTVFYAASSLSLNIYVAEADWDSATLGTPRLVSLRYDGKNHNPRWSSDGSRLGYVSRRDPAVLVFQDTITAKEEDFNADLQHLGWQSAWSPDLSRLIGPAKSPTQKGASLFEVDTKTGRRSLLDIRTEPTESVGKVPTFTSDGKHLIYIKISWTRSVPPYQLVELDLATRQERLITRELDGFNRLVAVSPDGSRLAACKNPYPVKDGDKVELVVASRADGATKTVAEFPITEKGSGRVGAWLPDNRRVLVAFEGKQSQQLYLVDTETGSSRPFGPPQLKGVGVLSIHPDGKRIAFDRGGTIQEIWAMKNFLPPENLAAK